MRAHASVSLWRLLEVKEPDMPCRRRICTLASQGVGGLHIWRMNLWISVDPVRAHMLDLSDYFADLAHEVLECLKIWRKAMLGKLGSVQLWQTKSSAHMIRAISKYSRFI